MVIRFYKNLAAKSVTENACWAETPFGFIKSGPEEGQVIQIKPPRKHLTFIFQLNLPELSQDIIESIAESILRKELPDEEVPDSWAESQFFTVVNEAIHKMEEIGRKLD